MPYILIGTPTFKRYAAHLCSLGYTPIELTPDPRLNPTVASHPDTLIWSDGERYIANTDYLNTLPEYIAERFEKTSEYPSGEYPSDTVFNALIIGKYLFAREKSLSCAVRNAVERSDVKTVNVNQGYARCSTLVITGENAAITADLGMALAMEQTGIGVLRIESGHIALSGCEYGFIGGASFVDEHKRLVCFFGDISEHPNSGVITDFIRRHGYSHISLPGKLSDLGGAVIVK